MLRKEIILTRDHPIDFISFRYEITRVCPASESRHRLGYCVVQPRLTTGPSFRSSCFSKEFVVTSVK